MAGSHRTIQLLAAVALSTATLFCSGCASPARRKAGLPVDMQGMAGQAASWTPSPNQPGVPVRFGQDAASGIPGPQTLTQVMAEIQQLGGLDPAAQDKLLENLQKTDPRLWPMVVRQVRANLAWGRQAEPQAKVESRPDATWPPNSSRPVSPAEQTACVPEPAESDAVPWAATRPAADRDFAASGKKLPAGDDAAPRPASDRLAGQPGPDRPAPADHVARQSPSDARGSRGPSGDVRAASYEQASGNDWRSQLSQLIRLLESEVPPSPDSDRDFAQHARLRLLYLLNGQRDAALRPIPSLALAMQQFWSRQLYGLATLLETELISEPTRRNAEAKRHLDSAADKLGQSCPLVVRNLAFVTDIDGFGVYKPFPKYEFEPGQRVLLYAEIESFESEETAKGFHTATRSSYQIFDSSGRRVAEHEFSANEEYCRNLRRDFYISYDFHLPERIFPGRHHLRLTVVDLKSQKVGQQMIEFTVKSTEE